MIDERQTVANYYRHLNRNPEGWIVLAATAGSIIFAAINWLEPEFLPRAKATWIGLWLLLLIGTPILHIRLHQVFATESLYSKTMRCVFLASLPLTIFYINFLKPA